MKTTLIALFAFVGMARVEATPLFLAGHSGRYETTASTANPSLRALHPYKSVGSGICHEWTKATTTGFTAKVDVSESSVRVTMTRTVSNGFVAKDNFEFTFSDGKSAGTYLIQGSQIVLTKDPKVVVGRVDTDGLSLDDTVTRFRSYPFPSGTKTPRMEKIGVTLNLSFDGKGLRTTVSIPTGSSLLAGTEKEAIATFNSIPLP